jgi:hypothetical protein
MRYGKILVSAITLLIVFTFISLVQARDIPGLEEFEIGGDENWKLKKNKKGIKVYLRHVKFTPMLAWRSHAELKGEISDLVAFLMDIEKYPEWMYPLTVSFILDKTGETEAYIYNVLKAPWPASARDIVVRRQWYYYPDTGAVIVTIKGLPEYVPQRDKDKIVRGYMIMAYYEFVPTGNNTIKITYEAVVDPGGIIPTWLVNYMVVYTPYTTLRQIKGCEPFKGYEGITFDFLNPPLLSENNPKSHDHPKSHDQRIHAIPGGNDYQEELEKQMRKVTYDQIKRYYFDDNPYGAQGKMKCYVWVEKGCPDMDINIQTVDDYKWSPIASFKINGEENKGKAVIIPDTELSRKSHTPGGVAVGINGNTHNNVNKLSGKVVTELINSYMKRSGADILIKIEKDKDPYIIYLYNEKEMTQKEIQDNEFRIAMTKYDKGDVKLVQKKDNNNKSWWKQRWWYSWFLGDTD